MFGELRRSGMVIQAPWHLFEAAGMWLRNVIPVHIRWLQFAWASHVIPYLCAWFITPRTYVYKATRMPCKRVMV